MNVGLPGAGIGGIFYILFALAMPFKELSLTLRVPAHKYCFRLIGTQLSIVAGIVLGVIAIYRLLKDVFGIELSVSLQTGNFSFLFYSLIPVLISFCLLLIILTAVRVAALISSPPEPLQFNIPDPEAPTGRRHQEV